MELFSIRIQRTFQLVSTSIIQHTWIPLLKIDIRTVPIFAIGLECHTIWQESVEPVYLFVLEVLVKPGSK